MSEEFLRALLPYVMDNGQFELYGISGINGWPEINYTHDGETIQEPLDLENHGVVEIGENNLTISCGGDWQEPHTVEIKFENGRVFVDDFYSDDYSDGLESELESMFNRFIHRNPRDIQRDMTRAVNREDYESAARFRDELSGVNNRIQDYQQFLNNN